MGTRMGMNWLCSYSLSKFSYIPYWKVAYPDVYLSAKDTNRAADLKVQLDYAVETWTAEFITGSKSVEADYDAFLNEIQKVGEEYLAIYQAAYAK